MNPRIEQKVELLPRNYIQAIEWLRKNQFKILYPERIVSSIYFDNNYMQSYLDTLEGNTPRRKIRIRSYGENAFNDLSKCFNFEIKLNSEFHRYKSQKKITDIKESLKNGIFDSQYGICLPIVRITYCREYFSYKNWRVTIDRSIKYENLRDNFSNAEEKNFVIEIKTAINENKSKLKNFFEFPRSAFSKYKRAVESFF